MRERSSGPVLIPDNFRGNGDLTIDVRLRDGQMEVEMRRGKPERCKWCGKHPQMELKERVDETAGFVKVHTWWLEVGGERYVYEDTLSGDNSGEHIRQVSCMAAQRVMQELGKG